MRRAAAYLLDLSLTDYKMVSVLPSSRAAAAVWVARRMFHKDPAFTTWPPTMVYYTSMNETTVRPVTCHLVQSLLHAEKSKLQVGQIFFWWRRCLFCSRPGFFFLGGVRSLERKGYFCQRFSVAVKSIYNQLRHDNSLLL